MPRRPPEMPISSKSWLLGDGDAADDVASRGGHGDERLEGGVGVLAEGLGDAHAHAGREVLVVGVVALERVRDAAAFELSHGVGLLDAILFGHRLTFPAARTHACHIARAVARPTLAQAKR